MNKEKKTRSKHGTAAQDPFDDDPMDVDATGLNLPTTIEDTLERYAIVYGTSTTIWDRLHRIPMRPADLRNVIDKALHKEFMNHPLKTVIRPEDVVFDPSQECAGHCVNLYQGLRIRAKAGDCTQILELLRHLLSASSKHEDEIEANIEWVLNWIALPLQKPGTKLSTAVVMHGPQGTGKSMFWEIVLKIYGEYGKVGGQQQLESKYNDWISRTLFAVMEEVRLPPKSGALSLVENIDKEPRDDTQAVACAVHARVQNGGGAPGAGGSGHCRGGQGLGHTQSQPGQLGSPVGQGRFERGGC